jgi:chromosome partitioning protein
MTRIIAITNQKGGVAKTTTSINLAASLVAMGRRVLLVDLDPQGNASMGSGIDKHALEKSACEVLLEEAQIQEAILKTAPAGFDILPTNSDLTRAQTQLMESETREYKLKFALEDVKNNYDYIIIDCPPSLSLLTVNALVAANSVLIPAQCEYFALEGLSDLLQIIDQIQASLNPTLHIEGVVRTMYDPRSRLTQDVTAELVKHFGEKLYRTVIPRNIRLAEAPSHGLPVLHFEEKSVGSRAYLSLAGELIRRETALEATETASAIVSA